jgi:biotin carboxylase
MPDLALSAKMKKFLPSVSTLHEAGVDHVVTMHHRDVYSCAHQLLLLQEQHGLHIQGVIPLSEIAVDVSDLLAASLGLPHHNPLASVLSRRDKGFMKQAVVAQHHGILRVAKFARISNVDEVQSSMTRLHLLGFPIVVKTPQGFSSTDVFICETLEEARTAVESIVGKIGPDGRHTQQALLEEYIEGEEFAVNLMVFGKDSIICVTDVWKYQKNHRADYESAENCDPNDPMLREIVSYAKQVAQAVGIHYGAAHVELKAQRKEDTLHYEDPVMMEVGARLSGGRKATMTQAAVDDWDPFTALIQSHCGYEYPGTTTNNWTPTKFVRHVFLPIKQSGLVRDVQLDTTPLRTLHSSALMIKTGDIVAETTDITSCAGFVWLVGERSLVDEDTAYLLETFHVHFDEVETLGPQQPP